MITLRILLAPGRRGRVVDASGRSLPQPVPAPVIGSAEPLRIILLDPSTLDPADPYGFDTGAPLRLTISGDWDPATIPVYATNALERTGVGTYDLADPSGTRTAEALALLGVLAERLCAWELTAYGGDPATEADWAHPLSVVQFDAPLRQRADSLGGDPAEAPSVDLRGPAGPAGPEGPAGATGPQGPKGDPQTPSDATPQMDGEGAAGTSTKYARGDHQHPSDTKKVNKSGDTMTGTLTVTDGADGQTNVAAGSVRVVTRYAQTAYSAGAIVNTATGKTRILPANNGTLSLQEGIAPAFLSSATYAVGAYCTHDGLLYRCTSAVSTAGDWNASDWAAVCIVDEMSQSTPLPFDAEVEYIECSNVSTYLDFYINSLYDLEMEVYLPNGTASTDTAMLGRWTNSHSHLISAANSKFNVYYGGTSTTSINNAPPTGSWFTMSLQGSVASCNGQTTSVTRKYDTDGASKMMIIATNDARIRRARISYGPHDLMDLHPVRVGSTAYFYDSARGILVGIDAGTATPGPDKATPTITLRWR